MLVMTPEILNNLLASHTLPFAAISLLIFDEAHHCTKKHPYAEIMRKYHELPEGSEKPKIFGMTASPLNTKAGSHEKMREHMKDLQDLMNAKLKTASGISQV
jgi:endoribonuclease Dicer